MTLVLVLRTSGQAADALHPVFEAPAMLEAVRARRHYPLHIGFVHCVDTAPCRSITISLQSAYRDQHEAVA